MWFFKNRKENRDIYEYWDGEKDRTADPLVLWHNLFSDEEVDLISDLQKAAEGQMEAHERISELVRKTFSVKPYEEGGLTRIELHALAQDFLLVYCEELKKKRGPMPLPLRYLVRLPLGKSTTKPFVDSSSTELESSTQKQSQCSEQSQEPCPVA